jgi:hypothetical protein
MLWVVIISVILKTVCSYGGKVIIVGGDNIGIVRTKFSYEEVPNCTAGFWRER